MGKSAPGRALAEAASVGEREAGPSQPAEGGSVMISRFEAEVLLDFYSY